MSDHNGYPEDWEAISVSMPEGWQANFGTSTDMAYIWIQRPGEGHLRDYQSPFFDAMIITPTYRDEDGRPLMIPPEDHDYYHYPRLLIHAPHGGDPVLTFVMRGDKLVLVDIDTSIVKFSDEVKGKL